MLSKIFTATYKKFHEKPGFSYIVIFPLKLNIVHSVRWPNTGEACIARTSVGDVKCAIMHVYVYVETSRCVKLIGEHSL